MTNEEAINILNILKRYYNDENEDSYVGFDNEDNEAFDMAIKALEQTELNPSYNSVKSELNPCVTPKARWIPVSERLPDDYIHVLCQFTLGGMGECYLAHGVFHVVGGLVMTCNEVIAWMPLPEPYKAESEE